MVMEFVSYRLADKILQEAQSKTEIEILFCKIAG